MKQEKQNSAEQDRIEKAYSLCLDDPVLSVNVSLALDAILNMQTVSDPHLEALLTCVKVQADEAAEMTSQRFKEIATLLRPSVHGSSDDSDIETKQQTFAPEQSDDTEKGNPKE